MGGWLRDFLQGPPHSHPHRPLRVGSHLRLPPACVCSSLPSPQPSPASLSSLLSLWVSSPVFWSLSPCFSVTCLLSLLLSTSFFFLSVFLFLPLSPVPSPLSPLQGGGPPLTRPAGPFMARAGEADTSTQPGVGLTLGPQSSSLSPPGPCLGPLPIPLC